jgi:hypothetical protein
MPKLLFHVADTFEIQGRGLVVATDTSIRDIPFVLRAGSRIEYRRPDGTSMESVIKGLEFSSPFNPNRKYGYLAADGIAKSDLPLGTEVWLIPEHD